MLVVSDEILFHDGSIDYDDDDGVRRSDFEGDLTLVNNILIINSNLSYYLHSEFTFEKLIEKFNLPSINYVEKLEGLIKEIWGDFEENRDYETIGLVNGTEIIRSVTKYSKFTSK
ncbi:hypothetical protein BA726_18460 [Klebsiella pneumoniae]|nr:hypothetical protein BA726_18460 [Klebsiella pneumoniae]